MVERELQQLVRRRLAELGLTPSQASRRSGGRMPAETIRGLARGQRFLQLDDSLATALATALGVPEGTGAVGRRPVAARRNRGVGPARAASAGDTSRPPAAARPRLAS